MAFENISQGGYWGPCDAVHTFCEPSYAWLDFAAEPINSLTSLVFSFLGMINLYRLHRMGYPLCWRATVGWWSLIVIGIGSCLFHLTMRYHMELLDEIPMIFLAVCSVLQWADVHPLYVKNKWLESLFVGGLFAATVMYIVTRIYGIFIASFTIGVVSPAAAYFYDGFGNHAEIIRVFKRGTLRIFLARVCWEMENHLCSICPLIWPLHSVWHFGSCLAASDLFMLGYLYRIDKLGVKGIVQLDEQSSVVGMAKPLLPMLVFAPASMTEIINTSTDKVD